MASPDTALVREVLTSMVPGPALQSPAEALDWLARRDNRLAAFLDGAQQPAGTGVLQTVHNPATGKILAHVAVAGTAEIEAAVAAALVAQSGWARLSPSVRAAHLEGFADGVGRASRRLALLDSLSTGRPLRDGLQVAIPALVAGLRYNAALALGNDSAATGTEPYGVVAVALPLWGALEWFGRTVAAALAAGNAVVVTVDPAAAPALLLLGEIAAAAGLPSGLIALLPGGEDTTGALLMAPAVSAGWCAARPQVARRLAEPAIARSLPTSFQTGAPSPLIVFEDADLDAAADGIAEAAWSPRGFGPEGSRLLLVQEGIAPRLIARLHARLDRLVAGDPLDLATDIGPLPLPGLYRDALRRLQADIGDSGSARFRGNEAPQDGNDDATWLPPGLVTDIGPGAAILAEPLAAPVAGLITFRTPDEAVMLANAGRFALCASLWTQSLDVAHDVSARIRAGAIWINTPPVLAPDLPLCGRRESGNAVSGGLAGFAAWQRGRAPAAAATGRQAIVDIATTGTAGAAVEAAMKAGAWSTAPEPARAATFARLADRLDGETAEIVRLFAAGLVSAPTGSVLPAGSPRRLAVVGAEPFGVAGIALSGAADNLLLALAILPLIAAGNRVVLASPEAAGSACEALAQALPAGVLSLVRAGPGAAAVLAAHPGIDALWHDGAPELAAVVAEPAAGLLKPVRVLGDGPAESLGLTRATVIPLGV